MYTNIDFEYHTHILTTFNLTLTNNLFHLIGEEISTEGPIHILYNCSESLALMEKKVQLEFENFFLKNTNNFVKKLNGKKLMMKCLTNLDILAPLYMF